MPAHAAQGREVPGYITLPYCFMLHFFKPLLLVLLVALCVSPAYAQTQQTEASLSEPYSPYKWEIGTDLLWLINKNQLPAQSVFARYNYQTAAGKSRGVRLRLGLDYMRLDSSGTGNSFRNRSSTIRPLVRIGYEFQQPYDRQFIYYGADLHLSYYNNNFSRLMQMDQIKDTGRDETMEIGPALFVGYKFFVTKRLSISTEISAQAIYKKRRFQADYLSVLHPGASAGTRNLQIDKLSFEVLPLSLINISFHI